MNIFQNILASAVVITLSSCTTNKIEVGENTLGAEISFSALSLDSGYGSKGAPITQAGTMPSMVVWGFVGDETYFQEREAINVAGLWGFDPEIRYPKQGTVDFVAYSPYSTDQGVSAECSNKSDLTIDYTVIADVTKQPDLMVAQAASGKNGDVVTLQFEHALSAIGFKVKGNPQLFVTSASIEGVANKATLSGTSLKWSGDETFGTSIYSAGLVAGVLPNADQSAKVISADDGYLMMIPQKFTSGNGELVIACSNSDGSFTQSLRQPIDELNSSWERAKIYYYTIDLSYDKITIDPVVGVTDWVDKFYDIDTEKNL